MKEQMNERIQELSKQATTIEVLSGRGFDTTQYTERFSKEKFAELIVRECIDTAFHKGHPDLEFLLKHFGVEE